MTLRISVTVDDQEKEIFSIHQGSDNSVYVAARKAAEVSLGDFHGSLEKQYVSLHPSPRAPYITINNHAGDGSGNEYVSRACVLPRRDVFCWPTTVQAWPNLSEAHYNLTTRPEDRVVQLGDYDPKQRVLVTSLVATTPGLTLDRSGLPIRFHVERFAEFDLHVGLSLIDLPSCPVGYIGTMHNYAPRLNGIDQQVLLNRPTTSPSPKLMATYLSRLMRHVADGYVDTVRLRSRSEGHVITDGLAQSMRQRASSWQPWPHQR